MLLIETIQFFHKDLNQLHYKHTELPAECDEYFYSSDTKEVIVVLVVAATVLVHLLVIALVTATSDSY